MALTLERYNPRRHDEHAVATLIFLADTEIMSFMFGEKGKAVGLVKKLMQLPNNHFSANHITCACLAGEVAGVIVGFDGKRKQQINKKGPLDYIKAFSLVKLLQTVPRLPAMSKIITKDVPAGNYYINSFSVDENYRGEGLGSQILQVILAKHPTVCLDVNINNHRAMKLYKNFGFKVAGENITTYGGKQIGTYLVRTTTTGRL
ncbi:GNAT family N-acetyltransferase [Dethiobacter alkaliphilus]|uniref:GCN5-related N-acetyltransferase n=1 Tax=Dethiobacter alkaliphilus AHT 1 TaxID=555088 RepID=C0GDD6_DETAL|nr:GNAT family N-acetyltransferase [Dethiobacter alkaliphilus]EEG78657.1 GCN5-related N-acetyltransferase [Dethiobacter alkaliphilus AHT 1]